MNKLLQLVKKDIVLLVREPANIMMILLVPLLMATIFGSIYGGSSTKSTVAVALLDADKTVESQQLQQILQQRSDLTVQPVADKQQAIRATRQGQTVAYLVIEAGFANGVRQFPFGQQTPVITIVTDPKRQSVAGFLTGATMPAVMQVIEQRLGQAGMANAPAMNLQPVRIASDIIESTKAAPVNAFSVTLPQALLWSILASVAIMSASLANERSQQIMLRLKVTAVSLSTLVGAKIIACMMMIIGSASALLLFGVLTFDLLVQSLPILLVALLSSAFCFAGFILALGTLGGSPAAISGAVWTLMILFAMLGGGMVPQFMMPEWLATVSHFSPGKWTIELIEGAIWRAFGWQDVMLPATILLVSGLIGCWFGLRNIRSERYL